MIPKIVNPLSIEESVDDPNESIAPPVIATNPPENKDVEKVSSSQNKPQSSANPPAAGGGEENDIAQLKEMLPSVPEDQIKEMYEVCGKNVRNTYALISEQLGIEVVDEDEGGNNNQNREGIAPEDVEFNMLAGNQVDNNHITDEERKMIEQAIRESEQQERAARGDRRADRNANPASQRAQAPSQQRHERPSQGQEDAGSETNSARKGGKKTAKKVDKKDGNNCCAIF